MSDSETEAMRLLDEFMSAFNARDVKAWEATFNYPSVRLASGRVVIIDKPGFHPGDMFERFVGQGWDHSEWDHRKVISRSDDKVHFDTRFTRYREDGSKIGTYDSIYVVTRQDGQWGVQARSSFAP
jgi:hypothetical protein